jgi:hypothetical protein
MWVCRAWQPATRCLRIYPVREFVAAGDLMGYGAGIHDVFRQAGVQAGRMLRGERTADLPTTLPSKFEERLWEMSDIVDVLGAWEAANRVGIC